jgi:hypothetical protein
MRLSKAQKIVVDTLLNGGWIWTAAGMPYLSSNIEGRIRSTPLHNKVFETLKAHKILKQDEKKWVLA